MLQHTEHTPGVEMVLLTKSFAVVKNDVCVMTSQVYLMMLLPTVRRVQHGSSFWGWQLTTIHPYVTFFRYSLGFTHVSFKNSISAFHPDADAFCQPSKLIWKIIYPHWSMFWFFYKLTAFHGYSSVFINDGISILVSYFYCDTKCSSSVGSVYKLLATCPMCPTNYVCTF